MITYGLREENLAFYTDPAWKKKQTANSGRTQAHGRI